MNIDEFAEITQRVITKNGFAGFLPTLCLPERDHIMVLEGVPKKKETKTRSIALSWAQEKAQEQEEFLLAIKEGKASFRIIRRFNGEISEAAFKVRVA